MHIIGEKSILYSMHTRQNEIYNAKLTDTITIISI